MPIIISTIMAVWISLVPVKIVYNAPESLITLLPQEVEEITISDFITQYARKYNVSENLMNEIIQCESQFKIDAVGDLSKGGSYGLVQIHKPSWPEITKKQAFDPEFAIEFLAKKLSENKGKFWSCYRQIVKNSII